jgi:hypothetical protein
MKKFFFFRTVEEKKFDAEEAHRQYERHQWLAQNRFSAHQKIAGYVSASAAVLAAFAAGVAAYWAIRAYGEYERQARAAERQAGISTDTEQRSLRAYLATASGNDDKDGPWNRIEADPNQNGDAFKATGWVTVRNDGETPAYDITVSIGVTLDVAPRPAGQPFVTSAIFGQAVVEKHGLFSTSRQGAFIIYGSPNAWHLSGTAIYIFGTVSYIDAFHAHRWQNYCLMFIDARDPGTFCHEHNDSDDSEEALHDAPPTKTQ